MNLRRSFPAALLCAALILSACQRGPADGSDVTDTAAGTEPAAPAVVLAGEGAPAYTIIRGDMAGQDEVDAAVFLRKYLDKCGVKAAITTDWEKNPVSEYEIVVGDTLRTDEFVDVDARSLGEEGYFVAVRGSRVFLKGGSAASTQDAVEHFLTEFFGYAGDPDTAGTAGNVTIAADYYFEQKQAYPLTAVTVDGRDLGEFRLAWDSVTGDYNGKRYAEEIQSFLYSTCGIWLELAEEGWDGPTLRLTAEERGEAGSFTVLAEDGDLILSTAVSGGMDLGWKRFCNAFFRDAEGELHLKAGTVYESRLLTDVIRYSEFGAVGDGVTDDFDAIIAAHAFANRNGLPVKADEGRTFRIGPGAKTAVIETDTDWTGATILLDDRNVTNASGSTSYVFQVKSTQKSYSIAEKLPSAFPKETAKFDITLETDCLVALTEAGTMRYIREGANANSGAATQEVIILYKDGTIDADNALIWDYTSLSGAVAYPIDEETLTITGGTIITRAAETTDHSAYFRRGIQITRSNVKVSGMTHLVEGEESTARTPYWGIITTNDCADITVENCVFTGRRRTTMGTYEITPTRTANLTFINCSQTNDINDSSYWGVMGSNYCKNITLDGCSFSRFDAHAGVRNVTIKNSTLGHQCLNAIGFGTLYIEDSTLCGSTFINLRSDYGSTWEGDVIIKNCTWKPSNGKKISGYANLIGGSYSGFHDFGYECYMPKTVTIDGLKIEDSTSSSGFKGINIFGNIVSAWTGESYEKKVAAEGYPYHVTENVIISGYESEQGLPWRLSANTYMFRDTAVTEN